MKFGRKKYGTQFINTEGKKKFMHDVHKLVVDATFTQMTREISAMYMEYTQIEDMELMGGL